jgi:acetylornithine deacetylase
MLETTSLLRDLVALPSVNPMGRDLHSPDLYEHRVTAYLEAFFRKLGVSWERQTVAPQRDNIVAWIDLAPTGPTLVFEAHQDTVPTDGMTIDPFGARIENNRLYGRGATDIKGGMAAMLAAFARAVRERPTGAGRLVMACSVDEEHTFLGIQRLTQSDLSGGRAGPVWAVVAEPTELHIVDAHKGMVRWELTALGRSCHSSRPERGINAIYHMADLLTLIRRYADELRASRVHPRLGPATLSVGLIDGGVSVNTVPDRCRIEIDRRLLPGEDADSAYQEFLGWLKQHVPAEVRYECSAPFLNAPPLNPAGTEALTKRLGAAIDSVKGSHEVQAVPYGTDAGPLSRAGTPAVVFGPGDIARAHTCDEWAELDQIETAAEILYRFVKG